MKSVLLCAVSLAVVAGLTSAVVIITRASNGAKANANAPTETERLLLERLILDSPDQFVLAQLRGASYFTVAGNEPGTVVHVFENVRVVTNQAANRVITVITTGN